MTLRNAFLVFFVAGMLTRSRVKKRLFSSSLFASQTSKKDPGDTRVFALPMRKTSFRIRNLGSVRMHIRRSRSSHLHHSIHRRSTDHLDSPGSRPERPGRPSFGSSGSSSYGAFASSGCRLGGRRSLEVRRNRHRIREVRQSLWGRLVVLS